MRIPLFLCMTWTLTMYASAQDLDVSEYCRKTIDNMKQVESIAAYKLHATVSFNGEESEIWIESRGNKVWAQVLRKWPSDSREAEAYDKVAKLLKTDLRETLIFDGREMITYAPQKMLVTVKQEESFQRPYEMRPVIPSSWTSFLITPDVGKITFSYFLSESLIECVTELDLDRSKLLLTQDRRGGDNSAIGYPFRQCEIDTENNLIRAAEASGGRGSSVKSSFIWNNSQRPPYVSDGKVIYGDKQTVEWKIDEFSTNPRDVRTTFTLDESKLPVGTRINDRSVSQRNGGARFIGGQKGQVEYDLQIEAIRLLLSRTIEGK